MLHSDQMTDEEKVPFAVELLVSNLKESMAFYELLGFEIYRIHEEARFATVMFQGSVLMLWEHEAPSPRGNGAELRFYIKEGLRALHDAVIAHGITMSKPYRRADYGLEEFYVDDPDGYHLRFCQ